MSRGRHVKFASEEERAEHKRRYSRAWRARNRDKSRRSWLKFEYGITPEQYDDQLLLQNGLCAICKGEFSTNVSWKAGKKLVVDHDHETGEVRGLLCLHCNTSVGIFENVEYAAKLRAYLDAPSWHKNTPLEAGQYVRDLEAS